jgi:hypothetical protein
MKQMRLPIVAPVRPKMVSTKNRPTVRNYQVWFQEGRPELSPDMQVTGLSP